MQRIYTIYAAVLSVKDYFVDGNETEIKKFHNKKEVNDL